MVKFIINSMLGSLARKLRIFGYDALYDRHYIDSNIIEIARSEARIILTSDKELHKMAKSKGTNSLLVSDGNDEERVIFVFRSLGLTPELDPKKSRCPLCNNEIRVINKAEINKNIPENIINKYKEFYICLKCGQTYWIGSHWDKIKKLSGKVKKKLQV